MRLLQRNAAACVLAFVTAGCASVQAPPCARSEQSAVSDQLYFGTSSANGAVTPAQWAAFLQSSVTPRFPAGLTVWPASGQWRAADGAIIREDSYVLTLVHPDDDPTDAAVRTLIADYKARFSQEAVLRVRSHACASF
ncbi:hypothetical protein AWB67_00783 [Caballeronia terrestris]|uniref:Lipoprotein n=1 Tax=Caballeronia terrestris TaxID=1226301 RepID=A0A158FQC5_9BURK|nr:DUF3574 domain-containing protein [Caballeronia terrestris]SAL22002.1 hypothetical protein AWB67_00783 [Caballeronia terrestris]